MAGLSVGYFLPDHEIGDVGAFCRRIREICGPTSQAFPMVRTPLKAADGSVGLFYTVIRGHVPVHIERRDASQACPTMFTFVLEADERPVLIYAPAGQRESAVVFAQDESPVPRMALGSVELVPGRAYHYDVSASFVGITSYPTGDPVPTLPDAVMVQVPWSRADDIGGAIFRMKGLIRGDERFADLVDRSVQ